LIAGLPVAVARRRAAGYLKQPMGHANLSRKRAEIRSVTPLGPELGRVELEGEGIGRGIAPGQFAMVEAPGRPDCVLLRPYSVFLAPSDDRATLLIKGVGKGSRALLNATPGQAVIWMGPLGNAFPEPTGSLWMVAGGVGAGPFGALATRPRSTILFGARDSQGLGFAHALEQIGGKVVLATDDGSAGHHGTVADLLRVELANERPQQIFTCGPTPMMTAVASVAAEHGIECYVSLEERMGCGFGVCRGCAHVDASGHWRCICSDGPVYLASEIFPSQSAIREDRP